MPEDELIAALQRLLGDVGCVLPDGDDPRAHSDASEDRLAQVPRVLLRPSSVEEISRTLALCHAHGQAVVPQGGLTGLAGGANVRGDEFALALSRFSGVEAVDSETGTITLRAGTILQSAQEAAELHGWRLPVDLGSRGSCQIGGVLATHAGGNRVIRDGNLRAHVLGLEVILADGTVLSHLSTAIKDNTGYALHQLFVGSEGTLGIITRAVIRLLPLTEAPATALCALPDYAAVLAFLRLTRTRTTPAAFEVMWREMFEFCGGRGLLPGSAPFVVLIETRAAVLESLLETAWENGLVTDALVAQSLAEAQRFWAIRDIDQTERPLRNVVNLDLSLPLSRMDEFVRRCTAKLSGVDTGIDSFYFGHLGDGNLHVLAGADQDVHEEIERVAYDLVREMNGSVSAEHGIGLHKRAWLGHSRSSAEVATMQAIRCALDPFKILNPGKVI